MLNSHDLSTNNSSSDNLNPSDPNSNVAQRFDTDPRSSTAILDVMVSLKSKLFVPIMTES